MADNRCVYRATVIPAIPRQAGDVVVSINGTGVPTVEAACEAAKDAKNVALLIQRDGQRLFVPLRVS